ncbi:hypothetical protein D3C84_318820 [compost metagenome]
MQPGRSASLPKRTRSVPGSIPTRERGNDHLKKKRPHAQSPGSRRHHRPLDPVGGGDCVFHAVPGRDHPQHRPARHGPRPGRRPAAHAGCDHCLHAHSGLADSRIGLDRRPLRHPENLLRCHCAVQLRLGAVCAVGVVEHADRRPGDPGAGWRTDAAGRTPGGAARLPAFGAGADHGLYHHSRPARSVDRPDHGGLDGAVPDLALDLPDQPAGGAGRLLCRVEVHP